jgi:hypothetical protein
MAGGTLVKGAAVGAVIEQRVQEGINEFRKVRIPLPTKPRHRHRPAGDRFLPAAQRGD